MYEYYYFFGPKRSRQQRCKTRTHAVGFESSLPLFQGLIFLFVAHCHPIPRCASIRLRRSMPGTAIDARSTHTHKRYSRTHTRQHSTLLKLTPWFSNVPPPPLFRSFILFLIAPASVPVPPCASVRLRRSTPGTAIDARITHTYTHGRCERLRTVGTNSSSCGTWLSDALLGQQLCDKVMFALSSCCTYSPRMQGRCSLSSLAERGQAVK